MVGREPPDGGRSGFSLPELLVVVSLIALALLVIVPIVAEKVRDIRLRSAVDGLVVTLRAARMVAVAQRVPISVSVATDPANYYEYQNARGELHQVKLPPGTQILSAASPIRFEPDGQAVGAGTIVIEAQLTRAERLRWTITANAIGLVRVQFLRL
ncbi:MAG TPA: GspH/FimT family pseudopilin [Candidatus Polarisedimenticolaceae bacterium]|nr:GspH/FimT family pseudopilin [Candidatus Polarisedimenticolaceae bacterium]